MTTLRIAWRNLGRNRKRTALALAAIALGQLTLVAVNGMMAGMFEDILRTITGPLVGHVQIHHTDWRDEQAVDLYVDHLDELRARIEAIPSVSGVSPRIYSAVLAARGEKTDEPADAEAAMVLGLDVAVEAGRGGILDALTPEELPGGGGVVVGKVLARRLGLEVGRQVAVIGQDVDEVPVSGLFVIKAIISGKTDVVNRLGIIMALDEAGRFLGMPDQAHELLVQGDEYRRANELAKQIAAIPALRDATVHTWREAAPELVSMLDMKNWSDGIFIAILFLAAAAGIANTMMMATFERRRELGMLLALGTRPKRVVRLVLVEAIILGLVGVAIGSVLGTVVVLITSHTGIDYGALGGLGGQEIAYRGLNFSYTVYPKFEIRQIVFGFAAVTATAVLASLWPAMIAARLEPAEATRT
ncbi:MAG: ABC transporter permease [Verrucomicrobia bacterium]|nr:ABC transporter permease [Verrucomicrobiota bacterium]